MVGGMVELKPVLRIASVARDAEPASRPARSSIVGGVHAGEGATVTQAVHAMLGHEADRERSSQPQPFTARASGTRRAPTGNPAGVSKHRRVVVVELP